MLIRIFDLHVQCRIVLKFFFFFFFFALWLLYVIIMALSDYNVLANVCQRMKIYAKRWHT